MQPNPKVQSPAALVGLTVVTLGLYSPFWYYRVNREMRDLGRASGEGDLAGSKPGRSVWALVLGAFVVVPAVVSFAGTAGRLARCERIAGVQPGGAGAITALIAIAYVTGIATSMVPPAAAAALVIVDLACWFAALVAIQRRLNVLWRDDLLAAGAPAGDTAVAA